MFSKGLACDTGGLFQTVNHAKLLWRSRVIPDHLSCVGVFQGLGDFSVHSVELDMDGLTVLAPLT